MPRTTLPDFDPLAHLGIGMQQPRAAVVRGTSLPAERVAKRAITPKVDPVPRLAIEAKGSLDEHVPLPELSQGASPEPTEGPPVAVLAPAATPQAPPLPVRTVTELRPSKAKTSARVPAALWDEVRDCVVYFGHGMTVDRFTEDAFRQQLKWLRKQHGLGDRFPTRDRDPKHGRRVS
jgi:hypothetical protein